MKAPTCLPEVIGVDAEDRLILSPDAVKRDRRFVRRQTRDSIQCVFWALEATVYGVVAVLVGWLMGWW